MADFPSKVTTETSTQNYQNSQQSGGNRAGLTASISTRVDFSFIQSVQGVLMMVEIVVGFLQWMLVACVNHWANPAYGWVLFVAVTLWILTTVLFFLLLFSVQQKMAFVPWPMTVMVYNGVATVLFLTAFIANAATVSFFSAQYSFGHFGASAFFAAVMTLLYGASAFFSYLDWRGDGGNAATSTVPT
ncbi:plasmolipin [Oryzias melastigma]|uniref:Plasmolipin n=1 Tax=Oryzias melastigma TaxID=30732 RepID=A0A3B3CKM5_ORYME|nr:plasmolipin [Oryzias melastigma]